MLSGRIRFLTAVPLLVIVLAACGGGTPASPSNGGSGNEARKVALLDVLAPSKPILTLSGAISATNNAGKLDLDLTALDALPQTTIEVDEPFLTARHSYTGVLVSDLLAASGISASARTVHMTALDDYIVDLDVPLVNSSAVLLASREDGELIPIDEGGPIRIVFGDEVEEGQNTDLWIWSVRSMEIR